MLAVLFYILLITILIFIINICGFISGLYFIIFLYVISFILALIIIKRNSRFIQFFGVPGSGKTTIASSIVKKANKHKRMVYSNVPINGAIVVDLSTISLKSGIPVISTSKLNAGVWYTLQDCELIIDESGLEFNNRSWKGNFSDDSLDFFKKHRHHCVNVYMFSQSYSDSDKKLRDLTTRLYLVNKSFFPFFIRTKRIIKKVGIDDITKQIIDIYKFKLFSGNYYFMPKYWKLFNTHEK